MTMPLMPDTIEAGSPMAPWCDDCGTEHVGDCAPREVLAVRAHDGEWHYVGDDYADLEETITVVCPRCGSVRQDGDEGDPSVAPGEMFPFEVGITTYACSRPGCRMTLTPAFKPETVVVF